MHVTLKDVEEKVKPLGGRLSYDKEFIFSLLLSYGRAPGNITRLRSGQLNVADLPETEVAQKNIVYFKATLDSENLYLIIDDLKSSPTVVRYSTRFVIVTDYQHLLAVDTKTGETLDIDIREIDRHYTFFLPWAGMEKAQFIAENHADVKAAEKMAKLFDVLIAHNGYTTALEWHNLTTFFTRLLFCFFAEDTNIFSKNQFSNAIGSFTQLDGSDLKDFLKVLFASLDDADKAGYPSHLAEFPYVNGQLFSNFSQIPDFNKQARDLLLESASKLDWSDINPDIFGSMFQAVVRPGNREGLGQHYTSVPNIMKTIEPLFLNELKDELNNSYDDTKKLEKLLGRLSGIKIFDPACGSGNFLIIAYKELRRLEHTILERQSELTGHAQQALFGSRINIENFYGIEIDDFPHEVAILSLWLAKHQMNLEFTEKFGIDLPLIPLKESGNIVHANAARMNWTEVCMNSGNEEIYLIGNPPYLGRRNQKVDQKRDMDICLSDIKSYRSLDYVSIWFRKAADFIRNKPLSKVAFVSTNSITQGEQVGLLWPSIVDSLEIGFAYTSFRWSNNATGSAGVSVVVISLQSIGGGQKRIYTDNIVADVAHINSYLAPSDDMYVYRRGVPLATQLPRMSYGNLTGGCDALMMNRRETDELLRENPEAKKLVRRLVGSAELLRGKDRYCLWISNDDLDFAMSISGVRSRIEEVRRTREASKEPSIHALVNRPHQFRDLKTAKNHALIVPIVFSERREYITGSFLSSDTIIPNSAQAIYDAELWVLGIVSTKMHMSWVRAVAGRLKTDLRYSSAIVYNNFPVPFLTEVEKAAIEEKTLAVLDVRENHPEETLAEMYDPEKMPNDLRKVHEELDTLVDNIYRKKPFENNEERLAHLFDLYETMTASERKHL